VTDPPSVKPEKGVPSRKIFTTLLYSRQKIWQKNSGFSKTGA